MPDVHFPEPVGPHEICCERSIVVRVYEAIKAGAARCSSSPDLCVQVRRGGGARYLPRCLLELLEAIIHPPPNQKIYI